MIDDYQTNDPLYNQINPLEIIQKYQNIQLDKQYQQVPGNQNNNALNNEIIESRNISSQIGHLDSIQNDRQWLLQERFKLEKEKQRIEKKK